MVFLYIVRCNFTEPRQEQAWNAWYSGPKITQMLSQPYFRSCQRFRLASGTGRDYLALWTVQSPQALTTPQYTSQWGFADWSSFVTDWSRDLFDGRSAPDGAFAVSPEGALRVVSFDHTSAEDASAAQAAIARAQPGMLWLPVAGLDRHTPVIGLERLSALASSHSTGGGGDGRIQQAIYRPISEFHAVPRAAP
jgi:hypothetical protein